jgi:hypothetical protein
MQFCQGDQIGRIYASWAFFYFGQFFKLQMEAKLFANFFHRKSCELIFTQRFGLHFAKSPGVDVIITFKKIGVFLKTNAMIKFLQRTVVV